MKTLFLAGMAVVLLTSCADQSKIKPVNPAVPYANERGPGAIGSPPLQQGSVPTR